MPRRNQDSRFGLAMLGWDDGWEREFRSIAPDGAAPGRVVAEYKGMYRVATEEAELWAEISGRLRYEVSHRAELPGVGDFVALRMAQEEGPLIIQAVLPRRTAFIRNVAGKEIDDQVIAANVDTVLIVSALDHEFNLRRLERYLTLVWESGAQPVILLNKADLCGDFEPQLDAVRRIAFGVPVHVISARTGSGLEELEPYFRAGATVSFVGSSGVGKSTLVNRLLGRELQAVKEVRVDDSRGRHTTTHRELFVLPQGTAIIDTPGMRELQLPDVDEGLGATFVDVDALAARCRFRDCEHLDEPGCAVRESVERGELDPERLASYEKLRAELAYRESRFDKDAMLERKRQEKVANKAMKKFKSR